MNKTDRHSVAEAVQKYLKNCRLNGITLEVVEEKIRDDKYWWEVPIRPNIEPPKHYLYYEAFADVEAKVKENENLTVFLTPMPAEETVWLTQDEADKRPIQPARTKRRSRRWVAKTVQKYLKDCDTGGVTLEVIPEGISRGEYEWRVPIRLDIQPPNLHQYFEALADVETELEEREHLNVFFVSNGPE